LVIQKDSARLPFLQNFTDITDEANHSFLQSPFEILDTTKSLDGQMSDLHCVARNRSRKL